MGRRRRKQATYRPQRGPPKIFPCPVCGKETMKVEKLVAKDEEGYAIIKCSSCLLEEQFPANSLSEPVDVYGDLIDAFYEITQGIDTAGPIEADLDSGSTSSGDIEEISLSDLEKDSSSGEKAPPPGPKKEDPSAKEEEDVNIDLSLDDLDEAWD